MTLTISTLVAVATVATMRSLTAARSSTEASAGLSQQGRVALAWISRVLRNVVRAPVDKQADLFVGGPDERSDVGSDRIGFFAYDQSPVRADEPESDLYEVSFYLSRRPQDDRMVLVERRDPALDDEPQEGGVLTVVAENVTGLEFEYFDGKEWWEEWRPEQRALPRMVRIHVLVEEDRRWARSDQPPRAEWYSLTVALPELTAELPAESAEGAEKKTEKRND